MYNQFSKLLDAEVYLLQATWLSYLCFAGLAWLLAYVWLKQRWIHRKIIAGMPKQADVRREIRYSLQALAIIIIVGAVTITFGWHGWTKLYWHIDERGWMWFWSSVVITIVLHDAYFYWTHRLMHHRLFFRRFHAVHHCFVNPTPWAAYALGPQEAIVHAAFFPLIVCIMPVHPAAFTIFMMVQILFNVLGHTGYEFAAPWLMDSWLSRLLNTATHHIMHHERINGNFGLYFNIWDRLMGTNHSNYEQRFRAVTSNPRADRGCVRPPLLTRRAGRPVLHR